MCVGGRGGARSFGSLLEELYKLHLNLQTALPQCREMRFSSFISGGFITAIVVNPPERKLSKCTSVQCTSSTWRFFGS